MKSWKMFQKILFLTISLIVPFFLITCVKDLSAEIDFWSQSENETDYANNSSFSTEMEKSETSSSTLPMTYNQSFSIGTSSGDSISTLSTESSEYETTEDPTADEHTSSIASTVEIESTWESVTLISTDPSSSENRYTTVITENETISRNVTATIPITTTTELMVTANSSICPVVIVTPEFIAKDFGTSASFTAIVESNSNPAILSRWVKIGSHSTEIIDINDDKNYGSANLPWPKLQINNITFDDEVNYQLQVQIFGGWCLSNTVHLEVRGRSTLSATYRSSEITTSFITVSWYHPYSDSDLLQSYFVRLREHWGPLNIVESIGLETNYTFEGNFNPTHLFYFEITFVVLLSDPDEMINVTSAPKALVVAPFPPGPIDRNTSHFHPERLSLRWEVPVNNTYVSNYRVTIRGTGYYDWWYAYTNAYTWPSRLEPGKNYTVTIVTRSWNGNSYQKESVGYSEILETLRTPFVQIDSSSLSAAFLSTIEITALVKNISDFPPTIETKWQKIQSNGIPTDIDVNETRYNGSTFDLFNPVLRIHEVDFYNEHQSYYQCAALNAEGWATSERKRVYIYGSLKFLEQCRESRECEPNKHLTCRSNNVCLCSSSYYHKDARCYFRSNLRPSIMEIGGNKCEISVKWRHPSTDAHLIVGYEVQLYSLHYYSWRHEETNHLGNLTEYATSCKHNPGRGYYFVIRSKILLSNPTETIYEQRSSSKIVLDLYPPGKIDRKLSNFSANNLYLTWQRPAQNTILNHYKVIINGHQEQTYGSFPQIYWPKKLNPGSIYNVTITAVSYGSIASGIWAGQKESEAFLDWIETDESDIDTYAYMPYGERDEVLRGDDVTSHHLKAPTTLYVGDGSEGGFTSVVIGTNGIIGLGEEFNSITIREINTADLRDKRIICPFWTDLLTVDATGNVYFKAYQRGINAENDLFLRKANEIIRLQFGDFPDFEATWLVKVTWENMTLFGDKSQRVTFQNLLITDGMSTFTVINYIDVNLKPIKKKQITIGYQYKKEYRKNSFSNKNAAFRMSKNPGNRGAGGFWIYKMTTGIPPNKDERECFDWYTQNKERDMYTNLSPILSLIECPCDSRLLRFDPRYAISRFDRTNRVLCYSSMTVGRNAECCFRMHGSIDNLSTLERFLPAAGTLLEYNPFFERQLYSQSDLKPKEACCKSGHCHWYYEVRPIPRCYWRSPFQPGVNFGDPHIFTLDGKNYTFNGFGEYTMMKIIKESTKFDFQARTELATTANGTTINATVFSAFVAQDHTGSKVQIDMTRDKTKMIIRVNGNDLTREFENANYTLLTQNLSVRWENQTISASFLQSSIILKVSLGVRFLISETVVDEAYKGLTKGLMGNFDGKIDNEFILPNGTTLNEGATKTERDIYFNFGQQWLVGNDSLFTYGRGLTYKNFSHPEFEPLFVDEADEEKLNEAKKSCGPNPSQACIFDFLATGDIALAESSGTEETVSKADIKLIENETPRISGTTSINVEVGNSVELFFNYTDDGDQRPKYNILKQPENFLLNQTTGIAKWTPRNISVAEISISVVDELGAESPSLDVSIVCCGGCLHGGRCDYENIIQTEKVLFNQAVCVCEIGYSGDRCETNTDACLSGPCPLNRECIDLTPEEEFILGRGYNCSDCPSGFVDVENKCEDIDECGNNGTNTCNPASEICENTEGSFVCNCIAGYRKENNSCIDIDECDVGVSRCESICENTPGSFKCQCHPGFSLNDDNVTCHRTDKDPCKEFDNHCEYTCNSKGQCICPIGYQLHKNGMNCTDIDECSVQPSLCQQNCININGSFLCSCSPGYTLNEDKLSCTECEEPNYRDNCSQICTCGPGMDRCNPLSGCVCLPGWMGENCTEDIDECDTDQSICGYEVCENLEGSYQCNCKEGFQRNQSSCEDIDECSDDSLYNCPENTKCENLYGNYTCACSKGYLNIDSICKDVDECDNGNHDCPQLCINTIGGFNCDCEFGYELTNDRRHCEKLLDMCQLFPDLNCSYGCAIKEEADKSFKGFCFCESGFKLDKDNSTCIDINECAIPSLVCEHNCTNVQGSFECGCSIGYLLQNDGRSCKACVDGRYGEDCSRDCKCGIGSERCHHVNGCVCKEGWEGMFCDTDVNECNSSSSPCLDVNEVCINTNGSYMCKCREGYEKSATNSCIDINECEEQSPCAHNCTNTNGSYMCTCDDGYELVDLSNCSDIDECLVHVCHICSNWAGGFDCSCYEGYSLNISTLSCHNINECEENIHNCSDNATCHDTDGGYSCTCFKGFEGSGKNCTVCGDSTFGVQCSETCECVPNNTDVCNHVNGSCQCKNGWIGQHCSEDVNECEQQLPICNETLNQFCFNTEGSAVCECRYGGLDINNCTAPLPPQNETDDETKVKVEIKFDVEYDKNEVLAQPERWKNQIAEKLNDFYKRSIRGFTEVIVLSIRFGSIIADHEIFASNTDAKSLKTDIANGLVILARQDTSFTLFNKSVEVKDIVLKHPNGTDDKHISSTSKPCSIFDTKEYCTGAEICSDESGIAVCVIVSIVQPEWTLYVILIGVSVPLLFAIIVLIICVFHKRKSKNNDSGSIQSHMLHNDYDLPKRSKDGFSDEYCTIGSTSNSGIYDPSNDYVHSGFHHNPMYDALKPSEQFRIKRPNIRMNN